MQLSRPVGVSSDRCKSSLTLNSDREKKRKQQLADKIFGSGKRSSLSGSVNSNGNGNGNGRKAPTGPASLASRVGITKVRISRLNAAQMHELTVHRSLQQAQNPMPTMEPAIQRRSNRRSRRGEEEEINNALYLHRNSIEEIKS